MRALLSFHDHLHVLLDGAMVSRRHLGSLTFMGISYQECDQNMTQQQQNKSHTCHDTYCHTNQLKDQ